MKLAALINTKSASVPDDGRALLKNEIDRLGHQVTFHLGNGETLAQNIQSAIDTNPDAMIVWGGDGSVACALNKCGMAGPPVLALPGGTMNLLHKRLHADLEDWSEILEQALTANMSSTLHCGEIDGHRFYVAAMMGKLTGLNESRENLREGNLVAAAQALMETQAFDLETRLTMTTHHSIGPASLQAVAGAIVVSDRGRPRLEAAAIDPASFIDFLSIGADALQHGWRESEAVDKDRGRKVDVADMHGEIIRATLDGEAIELPSQVSAVLVEQAARVLCARPGP